MARQYQIPGADYVDETGTRQYQIPGSSYVNETGVTSVPGGGGGLLSGVAGLFLFGPISFLVGSLLTSTLATAGDKPFFNPPHFAPNHHPSGEWLNPDTSKRAAPLLGGGAKPIFVAPHFPPHPQRPGEWLNPDTSQGKPEVQRPDQTPPRKPQPHIYVVQRPRNECLPADTTQDTPKTLFSDATTPLNVSPHFPPLKFWWQPPDSSRGTSQVFRPDQVVPRVDVLHFPPLRFWWQPPDSSRGTPQTVRPDQSVPFKVLPQPLLVDYRVQLVHDTSRGTEPSRFPVPLPPGQAMQFGVVRYQWIMPDTSSISHPIFYPAPTPPPPTAVSGIRLWQAGPKGVRTRARVRFWDDDSTKT